MTTTAAVMITDALKEIGVLGESDTPSAEMSADGLRMLNRLLDTFAHDAAFAFDASIRSLALSGQASFDVGPTGDIVTLRPIKITSAFATQGGIDYPVSVVSIEEYDSIALKATTGAIPECIAYNGVYPDGVVYVYPKCSGVTINLRTVDQVKTFATASTTIDMPEGYEDAITLNLAIRMAPSYRIQVSKDTRIAAKRAMTVVKRSNRVVPKLSLPDALNTTRRSGYPAILAG